MDGVSVRFQNTPNPNAGKFTVNRRIVEGKASRSYYNAAQASNDAVGAALFGIDGVTSLFMVEDFITVTKTPGAAWEDLIPAVTQVIERQLV